jgi:hypothetical protein
MRFVEQKAQEIWSKARKFDKKRGKNGVKISGFFGFFQKVEDFFRFFLGFFNF